MLQRNKRKIYHCKRVIESGAETFENPIPKYLNVLPVSAEFAIVAGGEINNKYLKIRCLPYENVFTEGDRFYVDVEPENTLLCKNADYIVNSIKTGHNVCEIILRNRFTGETEYG